MKINRTSSALLLAGLLGAGAGAQAAVITSSLGNTAPGFGEGDVPLLLTEIVPAQAGQPAPFDGALGSDLLSNATGSWTHSYAAIADPIVSATLDIGIVDHDSAASGNQVAAFTVGGNDLTATLNALLNGSGGGDGEYNVYRVDLGVILADLVGGSAAVELNLDGPGLQTCQVVRPGCDPASPVSETGFNGAHYIFSTLTITTREPVVPPIPGVPEPSTLAISLLGLGVISWRRWAAKV